MSWTPERIEFLASKWADGCSAGVIADELGGVTRSAVCGKVHRLGLQKRRERWVPRPPRQRKPRIRKPNGNNPTGFSGRIRNTMRPQLTNAKTYDSGVDVIPETPIIDAAIPQAQRRTLLQLTADTCRWPIGDPRDPDFFFCGAQPLTNLPYCAHHTRRAYRDLAPASRQQRAEA